MSVSRIRAAIVAGCAAVTLAAATGLAAQAAHEAHHPAAATKAGQ
jgi:hypothetical protein